MRPSHARSSRAHSADLGSSDAVGRLPIVEDAELPPHAVAARDGNVDAGSDTLGSPSLSPGGRDTAFAGGVDTFRYHLGLASIRE